MHVSLRTSSSTSLNSCMRPHWWVLLWNPWTATIEEESYVAYGISTPALPRRKPAPVVEPATPFYGAFKTELWAGTLLHYLVNRPCFALNKWGLFLFNFLRHSIPPASLFRTPAQSGAVGASTCISQSSEYDLLVMIHDFPMGEMQLFNYYLNWTRLTFS